MRVSGAFRGLGPLLLVAGATLAGAVGERRPTSQVSAERVRDHVFYLASDRLEGRDTGSEGHAAAMRYVERELIDHGAAPLFATGKAPGVVESERHSFLQDFAMRGVTVGREGALLVHRGRETLATARRIPGHRGSGR